jgi:hypothetical protein
MGLGIASLVVAPFTSFIPFAVPALLSIMAVPLILIGILIIIGGIFAGFTGIPLNRTCH